MAEELDRAWLARDYAAVDFARLSAESLIRARFGERFDIADVMAAIASSQFARHASVGQHGYSGIIPLLDGARFSVFLHAWYDDLANSHSHTWDGAYQVLLGTSVAALSTFIPETVIDPRFKLGRFSIDRLDILGPGATVAVDRGARFIHGLSYADRIGVAISIRTRAALGELTFDYWAPGLALESEQVDNTVTQRIKCLDALRLIAPARCAETLRSAIAGADFRSAFALLRHASTHFADVITTDELIDSTGRFGDHATTIRGAIAEMHRIAALERTRKVVRDVDQRFLLCGLHLAPNRQALLDLMQRHYPDREPLQQIESCLVTMASTPGNGDQSLLDTPMNAEIPQLLALLLHDDRPEAILAGLEAHYEAADIRANAEVLLEACARLRALPLLRPLFTP